VGVISLMHRPCASSQRDAAAQHLRRRLPADRTRLNFELCYRSGMRGAIIGVLVLAATARAQPPGLTDALPPPPADVGRDTHRVMLGAGPAVFANYPMSIEDPGVAVFATKPLWYGNRYRFFQWVAEANALVGFGTDKLHAYAAVGPQFGWNFYFGSVFGLEFRYGLDALMQVGPRTVGGLGFSGGGGYVFRLWDDDRKRLKLWMQMHFGFYLAEDPDNDLATNAGAFTLGLGYETPL
jgi:hypothetical protein